MESTDTFKTEGLGQVAIPVRDLARSVTFYREVLGLSLLFEVPGMAFFDGNGTRLMFSEQPEGPLHASILYYRVDDLDVAYAMLKAKGVAFLRPPHLVARMHDHELWMAFLKDPNDHTLALMAEIR
ncbi:MAG: VOC family protein [Rubricoccaceae bacterium]|nr:VOC family protein [Rubricoccaceae bacterium]